MALISIQLHQGIPITIPQILYILKNKNYYIAYNIIDPRTTDTFLYVEIFHHENDFILMYDFILRLNLYEYTELTSKIPRSSISFYDRGWVAL